MLKACIFDFDGVIVNSEPAHRLSFRHTLKNFNIKIPLKQWKKEFTGTGARHIMHAIFQKYKINEDIDEWVEKRSQDYEQYLIDHGLIIVPGFRRFYNELKKHKIKKCIGSGGHRHNIIKSLKSAKLNIRMPILSIESVKHRKPHPEVYLKAAKLLKTKPSECVVFEDSPAGIIAAKKAGMKVIALTTTLPKERLPKANMFVKDFKSISLNKLEKLFD